MKKLSFIFALFAFACVTTVNAQKQVIEKFEETQSRLLEVNTNAYVKPQVVDFKIVPTAELKTIIASIDSSDGREYKATGSDGRLVAHFFMTKEKVLTELKGELKDIRAWGIFQITNDFDADVLVGGVSDFKTSETSDLYELTIIGFPARFTNWKNIAPEDFQWINIENSNRKSDAEKTKTLIK